MQGISTIGLDIAKSVFQVHGIDAEGRMIIRRQLKRRYALPFFAKLRPCFTAQSPAVIVARKDFPVDNLREFVDYLKQNGDHVKQAHGGIGASSHMACLLFAAQAASSPAWLLIAAPPLR